MEIIPKKFKEIEIIFSKTPDSSVYINATETAKIFNKTPKDWLKTKDTQNYIQEISKAHNLTYDALVKVIKGNYSDKTEQGTWIHKRIIIAFARWLSPEFAVWCDIVIEEILKTGSYSISQPPKISIKQRTEDLEYAV